MTRKKDKSYFTVVIPTLNEESHLPHLLEDLQKQSCKDFEIMVVDACSTDFTQKIARKYKADLVISRRKNVSYQRNLGASKSNSYWIVFMDADNRIPKSFLGNIKKYLELENPDFLSTWMRPDGNSRQDKMTATLMNIFMEINKGTKKPYILESMLIARKESFDKLKGFNISIPWREGEELLESAIKKGMRYNFIKHPRYTYSFRRLKKIGTFKMLQEMSQMEIIKALKGGLTKKETEILYPMKGGGLYQKGKMKKLTLRKFISFLFD